MWLVGGGVGEGGRGVVGRGRGGGREGGRGVVGRGRGGREGCGW